MDLKLDPETMRVLVQKAVLDNMTPEVKETILVKALASLFQPDQNSYGRKMSPLEELFSNAANQVARDAVRAELEKPAHQAQIVAMVAEAWNRVMKDEERRNRAIDRMADALTDAMVSKEYR